MKTKKQIISHFREKPKTKTAWLVLGLGLGAVVTGPVASAVGILLHRVLAGGGSGTATAFSLMGISVLLTVATLILGVISLGKGERSWVVWLGFIPSALGFLLFILDIVGEFAFPH